MNPDECREFVRSFKPFSLNSISLQLREIQTLLISAWQDKQMFFHTCEVDRSRHYGIYSQVISRFLSSQAMALLSNATILYGFAAATAIWWLNNILQKHRANPKNLPLPPGPKGYPIIGSLLDFPTYRPWLTYNEWFKVYGMLQLLADDQILVLNVRQGT